MQNQLGPHSGPQDYHAVQVSGNAVNYANANYMNVVDGFDYQN